MTYIHIIYEVLIGMSWFWSLLKKKFVWEQSERGTFLNITKCVEFIHPFISYFWAFSEKNNTVSFRLNVCGCDVYDRSQWPSQSIHCILLCTLITGIQRRCACVLLWEMRKGRKMMKKRMGKMCGWINCIYIDSMNDIRSSWIRDNLLLLLLLCLYGLREKCFLTYSLKEKLEETKESHVLSVSPEQRMP